MIAFLLIIYVTFVVLIFKVFKVPPRPWPIALMVTLGVVMLGTVVVLWMLAAPISSKAVVTRYAVQLVPYVKGQVIAIPAKPNVPLKKGDILYEIDPAPYQFTYDQVSGQLAAAKSNVAQLEAGVRASGAAIKRAEADVAKSKAAFDVAAAIQKDNPQAISKLKMVEAEEQYTAAHAALEQANASDAQTRASLQAAKETVTSVEAQLQSAQFNLEQCTVRAPSDGFITDWQIREGTFVVAMPFAAAGSFIDTSETWVVAPFPAQKLTHVKPGQAVELAFKSRPGQMFFGTVENVIRASGEGQFTPSGKLPSAASIGSPGALAVKIQFDEGQSVDDLAMGTAGAVTIYSNWGKPFHVISKVTIRMKKWSYFLPLP